MIDFLAFSPNIPSSVEKIECKMLSDKGISLFVKREDLIHPELSGNKWRKLKYNLLEAKKKGHSRLLSFGGAYSNHIYALAAAGKIFGFQTIGVIRGEKQLPLNPTLQFAVECGMKLCFVSRGDYRLRHTAGYRARLEAKFGSFYLIPEGGTNTLALAGCAEMAGEAQQQINAGYYCVSCGTGGTISGMVQGFRGKGQVLGFSALRGDFLEKEVRKLLDSSGGSTYPNWQINTEYHFGGYARFDDDLIAFINNFKRQYGIPLDPVYTGKMFYGIFDLAGKGFFKEGTILMAIHTGGLQGIQGFNQRFGNLLT